MIIKGGRVYSESIFSLQNIETENGKIKKGGGGEVLNAEGLFVLPGLIDIHTHGCMGCDTMDATENSMLAMKKHMKDHGVTAFLPTTVTVPAQNIKESVRVAKKTAKGNGAEIIGVHLEGPYFSEKYKGAQNPNYLKAPSISEFEDIDSAAPGFVKIVSFAPELEGAKEFAEYIKGRGVTASVAHTNADYETVMSMPGITHATHLYNAMTPLNHRAPGVVGAIFDSDLCAELICDGVHIHPAAARIAIKIKGARKICLISDSVSAAGMKDGEYELGGQKVVVQDGVARIGNGALAGGTSNVLECMKNVIKWGIPFVDAVKMASENPAAEAGAKTKGKIKEGFDADFTILDKDLNLIYTIVGGEVVYSRDAK